MSTVLVGKLSTVWMGGEIAYRSGGEIRYRYLRRSSISPLVGTFGILFLRRSSISPRVGKFDTDRKNGTQFPPRSRGTHTDPIISFQHTINDISKFLLNPFNACCCSRTTNLHGGFMTSHFQHFASCSGSVAPFLSV